jgi:hypothetical protein
MPSAQAMSTEPLRRHRLSVEDYYKMGEIGVFNENDHVELIDGLVIDKSPVSSQHAYLLSKLNQSFSRQNWSYILVRIKNPLRLDQCNEPEPDIALVNNKNYSAHHPGPEDTLLVIEVADSSLSYDIEIKTPLYARYNIPEVWVINLTDAKIHVFDSPENGSYQNQKEISSGKLTPVKIKSFVLDLDELWKG